MRHGEGRAGSSMCGLGYCAHLTQQFWEAQGLGRENPQADEEAGHEAQESPQILGSDFSQVEGHHTETDTWGAQEGLGWQKQLGEGYLARPLVHLLPCPASSTVGTPRPWRWPWLYQRTSPQSLWGVRSLLHHLGMAVGA